MSNRKLNAARRSRDKPIRLDEAIRDPTLIAPFIRQPTEDYGDPEAAIEMAARREEGFGRHGFRSLLDDLD